MPSIDTKAIMAEIRANHARLDACPRHRFWPTPKGVTLFEKHKCVACQGTIDLSQVGAYVSGYVAHGGDANDIWPGWE